MVSGYSVSSGGDRPTESISLNFTKILYEFNEMNAKNEKGDSPKGRVGHRRSEEGVMRIPRPGPMGPP